MVIQLIGMGLSLNLVQSAVVSSADHQDQGLLQSNCNNATDIACILNLSNVQHKQKNQMACEQDDFDCARFNLVNALQILPKPYVNNIPSVLLQKGVPHVTFRTVDDVATSVEVPTLAEDLGRYAMKTAAQRRARRDDAYCETYNADNIHYCEYNLLVSRIVYCWRYLYLNIDAKRVEKQQAKEKYRLKIILEGIDELLGDEANITMVELYENRQDIQSWIRDMTTNGQGSGQGSGGGNPLELLFGVTGSGSGEPPDFDELFDPEDQSSSQCLDNLVEHVLSTNLSKQIAQVNPNFVCEHKNDFYPEVHTNYGSFEQPVKCKDAITNLLNLQVFKLNVSTITKTDCSYPLLSQIGSNMNSTLYLGDVIISTGQQCCGYEKHWQICDGWNSAQGLVQDNAPIVPLNMDEDKIKKLQAENMSLLVAVLTLASLLTIAICYLCCRKTQTNDDVNSKIQPRTSNFDEITFDQNAIEAAQKEFSIQKIKSKSSKSLNTPPNLPNRLNTRISTETDV